MELNQQQCHNKAERLTVDQLNPLTSQLHSDWQLIDDAKHNNALFRRWQFKDFVSAMAFVNQAGDIAEQQDHHPDIRCGWGYCEIRYTTHSANGLTLNDFICASKLDLITP